MAYLYRRLLEKRGDDIVFELKSEIIDKIENVQLSDNHLKDLQQEGYIVVKLYNNSRK